MVKAGGKRVGREGIKEEIGRGDYSIRGITFYPSIIKISSFNTSPLTLKRHGQGFQWDLWRLPCQGFILTAALGQINGLWTCKERLPIQANDPCL